MSTSQAMVEKWVGQMTLEQKVTLLTGRDFWNTHSIESIGLRNMLLSDGPSGVRGEYWDERDCSLNLPSATAVSSSWDPGLLEELGRVLGDEAQRKGVDVVLGPTINLHRSPLGGRHFECFSEDPLLTGVLATSYVRGLQSKQIGACPKHYIANDFETDRFNADVVVDERTLREVYMRPFEDAVVDGGAWTIMSSYNSINGTTATENSLLNDPLRTDWGFDGVVISDWTAVRSLESATAEQDLVMPGPVGPWGEELIQAVKNGEIEEAVIDRKIVRLLTLAERVGAIDSTGQVPPNKDRSIQTVPESGKAFSRRAASAGTVMLKNDDVLPLDFSKLGKVALIGHNASQARTQGGGSATVIPDEVVTPLDALSSILGDRLEYSIGAMVQQDIAPLTPSQLFNTVKNIPGVSVRFLDENKVVIFEEDRLSTSLAWIGSAAPVSEASYLNLVTQFTPEKSGTFLLGFASGQPTKIMVDGRVHMDETLPPTSDDPFTSLMDPPQGAKPFEFVAGTSYAIELMVDLSGRTGISLGALTYVFGFAPDNSANEALMNQAIENAKSADLAIVVVGTNSKVESEGYDRSNLSLPGLQDELVREVLKVNSNVVVVVNAGSPVLMPWADEVRGILVTYFGGQEMGNALLDVLTGAAEPGGRLPTTWPRTEEDVPVLNCTPDSNKQVFYEEGIHIGYRAWDKAGRSPLFPFGAGLGYTSWQMQDLVTPSELPLGQDLTVKLNLTNTGKRKGKQVVQVFLSRKNSDTERPVKWLAGFATVNLDAEATTQVSIQVKSREFSNWNNGWEIEKGTFELRAGFNSQELNLGATVTLI